MRPIILIRDSFDIGATPDADRCGGAGLPSFPDCSSMFTRH
jgi:phosphopentomutase